MLNIDGVSIRFGDQPEAVSQVSFQVAERDKMVVIGETGSGKSVLLLALLGMLPRSASVTGHVWLEGRELLSLSPRQMNGVRGRRMAYIPQGSGNGLNPLYTLERQIGEVLVKRQGLTRAQARPRVQALLAQFGLNNAGALLGAYPFMLSGGMRQRALIAMGMAAGAPLILADEPTKGLDQRRIEMVIEAFRKLQDRTLLCVTHDLRFAQAIASRITVMYASEQIESASRDDFFARPLHPYAQAMLAALPENGLHAAMGFAPPRINAAAQRSCHFIGRCPAASMCCNEAPPMVDLGNRKVRCWQYAP